MHSRRQVESCLSGEKITTKRLLRLLCTDDHTLRKSINPFTHTHFLLLQGINANLYYNAALHLLPGLYLRPHWHQCLHLSVFPLARPVATLYGLVV